MKGKTYEMTEHNTKRESFKPEPGFAFYNYENQQEIQSVDYKNKAIPIRSTTISSLTAENSWFY